MNQGYDAVTRGIGEQVWRQGKGRRGSGARLSGGAELGGLGRDTTVVRPGRLKVLLAAGVGSPQKKGEMGGAAGTGTKKTGSRFRS